eukprot:Platyproteum_vivax@DN3701_c0_g1_i1.p1
MFSLYSEDTPEHTPDFLESNSILVSGLLHKPNSWLPFWSKRYVNLKSNGILLIMIPNSCVVTEALVVESFVMIGDCSYPADQDSLGLPLAVKIVGKIFDVDKNRRTDHACEIILTYKDAEEEAEVFCDLVLELWTFQCKVLEEVSNETNTEFLKELSMYHPAYRPALSYTLGPLLNQGAVQRRKAGNLNGEFRLPPLLSPAKEHKAIMKLGNSSVATLPFRARPISPFPTKRKPLSPLSSLVALPVLVAECVDI